MCVCTLKYTLALTCMPSFSQKSIEGIVLPGAKITGGCELPSMGVMN